MSDYTIKNQVQAHEVDALLFLNTDFETEYDEDMRDYIVGNFLEVMAERDHRNGNWYWNDDAPADTGEVIEAILNAPDAPEGIRDWYDAH